MLNLNHMSEIISSISSNHNGMKLDINNRRKDGKSTNMWKLNSTLSNNCYIKEEIKKEIKKCLEMNENGNTICQNLKGCCKRKSMREVISNKHLY